MKDKKRQKYLGRRVSREAALADLGPPEAWEDEDAKIREDMASTPTGPIPRPAKSSLSRSSSPWLDPSALSEVAVAGKGKKQPAKKAKAKKARRDKSKK